MVFFEKTGTGVKIVSSLQSGTAKQCAEMATYFVISHSDELANLRTVLVQRSSLECQFLLRNGSFLESPVLWIVKPSTLNSTPEVYL